MLFSDTNFENSCWLPFGVRLMQEIVWINQKTEIEGECFFL